MHLPRFPPITPGSHSDAAHPNNKRDVIVMAEKVKVKFLHVCPPYMTGETAVFDEYRACELVEKMGVAKYITAPSEKAKRAFRNTMRRGAELIHGTKQRAPKQAEQPVVDRGPKTEQHDDWDEDVDGPRPGDETEEEIEPVKDEDKEKAQDAPKKHKQVKRPRKKKAVM